jgi:hypothetical protein
MNGSPTPDSPLPSLTGEGAPRHCHQPNDVSPGAPSQAALYGGGGPAPPMPGIIRDAPFAAKAVPSNRMGTPGVGLKPETRNLKPET